MENNIMRDLTLNEIEEVNGGIPVPVALVGYVAIKAAAPYAYAFGGAYVAAMSAYYAQRYGREGFGSLWSWFGS